MAKEDSGYKPIQASPIINLASKMDDRTSNEYLDVDPNTTSFTFVNLENADLFNTKSLSTRLGVKDIGNGIINADSGLVSIIDLQNNLPANTASGDVTQINANGFFDYQGLIIIPSGGQTNIYSGTIVFRSFSATPVPATDTHVNVGMRIYALDQTPYPASGLGFMSGTGIAPNNIIHNIALSGNYNVPPFPRYQNNQGATLTTVLPTPNAISNTIDIDLGPFTFNGANYISDYANTSWKFEAPFPMSPSGVYFLQTFLSGTSQTSQFAIQYISNDSIDISKNTRLGQEFFYIGAPATQANSVRETIPAEKAWLNTNIFKYVQPSYVLEENPTAIYDLASPLISGTTFNGGLSNENVQAQIIPFVTTVFTGSTMVPNFSTKTVEMGQIYSIPSGTWNIYGGYFYATPNDRPNWSSYTRNKMPISGNGYNLGYAMYLSEITSSSGSIATGNYEVVDRNIVAVYSGNYVFGPSGTNTYSGVNTITPPNFNLNKIYALFDNPPVVSVTSGTNYLLSVKFYDFQTGGDYTDFSYRNITTGPFAPTTQFQSFIQTGYDNSALNTSGTYVTNYSDDGQTFISPSGDANAFAQPKNDSFTSGLIYVASGNAITGIYDYRIGSSRAQRVILGQENNILEFPLNEISGMTNIYSGAAIGDDFKWSFATYQNLLFAHQYAQSSGVCWDQRFINPSGHYQSMQFHGQQPQFSLFPVVYSGDATNFVNNMHVRNPSTSGLSFGINNLVGSTVSVMLATQMNSGGYRAETHEVTIPNTQRYSGTISGTFNYSFNKNVLIGIIGPSGTRQGFQSFPNVVPVPSGLGLEYPIWNPSGVLYGNNIEGSGLKTEPFSNAPWDQFIEPNAFPYISQYAFDIPPQATYVFVTGPNGTVPSNPSGIGTGIDLPPADIFYLAPVVSINFTGTDYNIAFTEGGNSINPLSNKNTFIDALSFGFPTSGVISGLSIIDGEVSAKFIYNIQTVSQTASLTAGPSGALTQQIPNIINFDQSYLNEQVPTPKFKKILVWKDYLIGIGDPDFPSRIWYSQQLAPQIWGTDGNVCGFIELDPDNGSPITGMDIYKDYLIVFKYNSTYKLSFTQNPSIPFYVYQTSNTLGSLGFFGTVSTDYGVFALSQFGPILATNNGVESIGDEIVPFFQTLDHTDLTFAVAIHDRERQQIYWSISSKNLSPFKDIGLVYSYVEKAWNIRKGGMWNAAGIIGDEDNFNQLYVGDNIGQIQQISVGNQDEDILFNDGIGTLLTRNISLEGETPWLNFGNSMNLKNLRNIRINCATSKQRLRMDVYYDQDMSKIQYTRYINMNVPVINRVASLGGRACRTAKFVFTTVGVPSPVQINSLQFAFQDLGKQSNF